MRYSDGTSDRQNVTWDAVSDDQIAKAGSFSVAGTVAGQKISVRVTMIDEPCCLARVRPCCPTAP